MALVSEEQENSDFSSKIVGFILYGTMTAEKFMAIHPVVVDTVFHQKWWTDRLTFKSREPSMAKNDNHLFFLNAFYLNRLALWPVSIYSFCFPESNMWYQSMSFWTHSTYQNGFFRIERKCLTLLSTLNMPSFFCIKTLCWHNALAVHSFCHLQLDHDLKHAHELRQAAFKLYASLGSNDEDIRKKVTCPRVHFCLHM